MFAVNCTMNTYEITDISQYRTIPGTNYYGKYIAKYSNLVMPKKIEDFFIVEKYLLMYDDWNGYHEEYLEIRIEDETQYQEYIKSIIDNKETEEFFYDKTYLEHAVNDYVDITSAFSEDESKKGILTSKIQKILFCDEGNIIIFLSLTVPFPDGPVSPDKFYYFRKFNIDATTYYGGEKILGGY
jgi:hypothetical protein